MEIKIEHKTKVTLFDQTFEMNMNEFADFLTACQMLLEWEGYITDKPMIKITKEGLQIFRKGVLINPIYASSIVKTAVFGEDAEIDKLNKEVLSTHMLKHIWDLENPLATGFADGINSTPIETTETIQEQSDRVMKKVVEDNIDEFIELFEEKKN